MSEKMMSRQVVYNAKAIAASVSALIFVVYVAYTFYPRVSTQMKQKLHLTWLKSSTMQEIPDSIKTSATKINVQEKTVDVNVAGKTYSVFYRFASPPAEASGHVLFLHGMAFTSETWHKLHAPTDPDWSTLSLTAALGYHTVAVDLPGFGNSALEGRFPEDAKSLFLEKLIQTLGLKKPIIVSPSMSGSYSIRYIMGSSPGRCEERVGGFIPIAPAATDQFEPSQYHRCQVPVMIVYGSKDTDLGLKSTHNLRNMAMSEVFPMRDASHPCYMDNPAEWHKLLYNYLTMIKVPSH